MGAGGGGAEQEGAGLLFDDAAGDPEAESGAALAFGGEEGFEDGDAVGVVDAVAGVGDGDDGVAVAEAGAELDAQGVGGVEAFHGFEGVADEVGEDLAEGGVVVDAFDVGAVGGDDLDVLLGGAGLEELPDFIEQDAEVEGAAGDLAVEAEGGAGDVADAVELAGADGDELEGLGGELEVLQEEEDVGEGFEGVVDLVGEGVGHATGGGEALGVDEAGHEVGGFALGGLAGGDVFDDPEDGVFGVSAGGSVVLEQGDGEVGGEGGTIGAQEGGLHAVAGAAAGEEFGKEVGSGFAFGGKEEVAQAEVEDFFLGKAEGICEALVDEQEVAGGGGVGHADGGLVEGGGEALLGEAEFGFGAEALLAAAGFGEFAFDGGKESFEVSFEDVVVGAGAHGVDGGDLVDGSGDDDEGEIVAGGLEDAESFACAEAGEGVVGDDEVPGARVGESAVELLGGVDAAGFNSETDAGEVPLEQERIFFVVLNDEDTERTWRRIYAAGGHWLSSSQ
jgi:hypothetical protein